MDGVVFFGGVHAGELEDDVGAARVGGEEGGDIPDGAIEDDPAGVFGFVLLYLDCLAYRFHVRREEAYLLDKRLFSTFSMMLLSISASSCDNVQLGPEEDDQNLFAENTIAYDTIV